MAKITKCTGILAPESLCQVGLDPTALQRLHAREAVAGSFRGRPPDVGVPEGAVALVAGDAEVESAIGLHREHPEVGAAVAAEVASEGFHAREAVAGSFRGRPPDVGVPEGAVALVAGDAEVESAIGLLREHPEVGAAVAAEVASEGFHAREAVAGSFRGRPPDVGVPEGAVALVAGDAEVESAIGLLREHPEVGAAVAAEVASEGFHAREAVARSFRGRPPDGRARERLRTPSQPDSEVESAIGLLRYKGLVRFAVAVEIPLYGLPAWRM